MKHLKIQNYGAISVVEVCRPEALNALNRELLHELQGFLQQAEQKANLRAVILTGSGDKAFIAGADIKEMSHLDNHHAVQFCYLGQQVAEALERATFLTIAAVNGYALGGGLELVLACDYAFAAEEARMGCPEVTLGLIPGFGGTQRLARAIGTRAAKELILSGRTIKAEEAHDLGIVQRVVKREALINECLASAKSVVTHSALAIAKAKYAIDKGYEMSLHQGLDLERHSFVDCFASPGRVAGFETFLNKNK